MIALVLIYKGYSFNKETIYSCIDDFIKNRIFVPLNRIKYSV